MTNTRINDLRDAPKTLVLARELFDAIAMQTIKVAVVEAKAEQEIAAIKQRMDNSLARTRAELNAQTKILAQFIEQNRDLFLDPRKIKTSLGSFGLQAVSELVVEDEKTLCEFLDDKDLDDCFTTVIKLIKDGIKKRITDGEKIPGAYVKSGDTVVIKISDSVLKTARKTLSLPEAANG